MKRTTVTNHARAAAKAGVKIAILLWAAFSLMPVGLSNAETPLQQCSVAAADLLRQAGQADDIEQAISLNQEAIKVDDRCLDAYLLLAEKYAQVARWSDIVNLMQQAKAIAPGDARFRLTLIFGLYWDGHYEQLLEEARAAEPLVRGADVGFLGYYAGLAGLKVGNIDLAVRWFELGVSDRSYENKFQGLIETELVDQYQTLLNRGFDPTIAMKLGRLLYQRDAYIEAYALLSRAVDDAPNLAEAYYWLALVHFALGNQATSLSVREIHIHEAQNALMRYLELSPQGEFAGHARQLLQESGR